MNTAAAVGGDSLDDFERVDSSISPYLGDVSEKGCTQRFFIAPARLAERLHSEVSLDYRTARGCSISNVATAQAPPGFQLTGQMLSSNNNR
jgi:hypothetical protein